MYYMYIRIYLDPDSSKHERQCQVVTMTANLHSYVDNHCDVSTPFGVRGNASVHNRIVPTIKIDTAHSVDEHQV